MESTEQLSGIVLLYITLPSRGSSGRRHTNEGSRHLVKMNLYFPFEFSTCIDLFITSIGLKACSNLIQNENSKSLSPSFAVFNNFLRRTWS